MEHSDTRLNILINPQISRWQHFFQMRATFLWVCFLLTWLSANASSTKRHLNPSDDEVKNWLHETLKDQERSYIPLRIGRHRFYLYMQEFSTSPVDSCTLEQSLDKRSVKYLCFFHLFEMKLNVLSQNNRSGHYDILRTISLNNVSCQATVKFDEGTFELEMVKIGSEDDQMQLGEFHNFPPDLLGKPLIREGPPSGRSKQSDEFDPALQEGIKKLLNNPERYFVDVHISKHSFFIEVTRLNVSEVSSCIPDSTTDSQLLSVIYYNCSLHINEMELYAIRMERVNEYERRLWQLGMRDVQCTAIIKSDNGRLSIASMTLRDEYDNMTPAAIRDWLLAALQNTPLDDFVVGFMFHLALNRDSEEMRISCCGESGLVRYSNISAAKSSAANRPLTPPDYEFHDWLKYTLKDHWRSYVPLRIGRHRFYLHLKKFSTDPVVACKLEQFTEGSADRSLKYICFFYLLKMQLNVLSQNKRSGRYNIVRQISLESLNSQAIVKSDERILEMEMVKIGDEEDQMRLREFHNVLPDLLGKPLLREDDGEEDPNFAVEPVKHNTNRTTASLLTVKRSGFKFTKAYKTGRHLKPSDHAFQKWFKETLDDRKRSQVLLWLGRHKCYLQMNMLNISIVTSCTAEQITYEDDQPAVEYICQFFIYKMEMDVIYQVYNSDRKYKLQTISMENVTADALIKSTNGTLQMKVIKLENEYNQMTHREYSDFLPGFLGQSKLKEKEKGFIFHFTLNFIYDAFSVYCCDANGFISYKRQASM